MKQVATLVVIAVLSLTLLASIASANCTIGYWKNHGRPLWVDVSLMLGDVLYTHVEALQILNQPTEGNGLVSMSRQLIAAKLNVLSGADPIPAIGEADALIGPLVVPPIGSGFLETSVTHDLNEALTDFNESGIGNCFPVSIEEIDWGRVKTAYR